MAMIRVEFDQWPMLITVVAGVVTDEEVELLKRENDAALSRREPFVSLVEVEGLVAVPTPAQRRNYAAWRIANLAELGAYVKAVAFVTGDKPAIRSSLAALSWLVRHPGQERVFVEREAAHRWLEKRFYAERA